MDIDVKFNNVKVFEDLVGGDTFYYPSSGVMWIKLLHPIGDGQNAVSLDDGTPAEFYNKDDVIVIKTKLVNDYDD